MKQDIKQKIIWETIRLIEGSNSRLEEITIREICREAGISVSQINYHFQTKENLIAKCVQVMIGDVIGRFSQIAAADSSKSAVEKLKNMLARTMGYLFSNENISKISILTDHQKPHGEDNTAKTIQAYLPLVEAAMGERNITDDPYRVTSMIILYCQGAFLRADVIKKDTGADLLVEDARRQWIHEFVERILASQG